MLKILMLIVAAFALNACALSSKTYGPDGEESISISCTGSMLSWGLCYEKAGDICGRAGYNVLSRSSDGGAVGGGNSFLFGAGTTTSRSMLVQCKR